MLFFEFLVVFVFGVIIGSFLNVVIYRYNSGRSVGGRSNCGSCGRQLTWKELIPIVSFFMQRGRCTACGARISWQYPLVELLTGILFVGAYAVQGFSGLFILDVIIFCLLVVIFFYDIKHKIIPNLFVYLFIALSLIRLIDTHATASDPTFFIYDLLTGIALALCFFALWIMSRGAWIGLGDAKLVLGIGWFLGLVYGLSALFMGFWLGAIVGLIFIFLSNNPQFLKTIHMQWPQLSHMSAKSELPFAPFLITGLWLAYFFQFDVLGLHLLFSLAL